MDTILLEQIVGKRQMKIQISLWARLIRVSFVGSDLFYFVPKFPEAVTGLYSAKKIRRVGAGTSFLDLERR